MHPRAAAIVGLGLRSPGGTTPDGEAMEVRGPAAAWEALRAGVPAITRYPARRWERMQERLHPDDRGSAPWPLAPITLPTTTDAAAFGLRASDVDLLSPSQILILEIAAEALADAGIPPSTLAGPRTGIYLATSSPDEALTTFADGTRPRLADLPAGGAGMLGTHLSRWLNTLGPLPTLDTTCSSSAYALHTARRDLTDATVDVAVVIGINTCDSPVVGRAFGDGTALAEDGDLAPYDERAHGYVRGEGAVAVVLRPYRQARRAHERIYAVLEHTAVGSDGRSAGVGLPSWQAQADLIGRALIAAQVHPDAVDLWVGHGTATAAGDNAERKAFAAVCGQGRDRGRGRLWPVWSAKGLWGHAEGASGLQSVAATALMLHH
ncbi:hypothetical protein ADL05_26840, partial [Nocardiopsis sp. NRRL B-16309]